MVKKFTSKPTRDNFTVIYPAKKKVVGRKHSVRSSNRKIVKTKKKSLKLKKNLKGKLGLKTKKKSLKLKKNLKGKLGLKTKKKSLKLKKNLKGKLIFKPRGNVRSRNLMSRSANPRRKNSFNKKRSKIWFKKRPHNFINNKKFNKRNRAFFKP